MNISLHAAGNKKRKKGGATLAFGLNNRKNKKKISTTSASNSNAFGDDGDSSDDESDNGANQNMSRREVINKQIAREQAARRRRAQIDLASAKDNGVYDYDGSYESFRKQTEAAKAETNKDPEKKSKYIGDLLKAAKTRERERDAIYERRNAREQAEEDSKSDYRGKEKFVTNAYKRKLKERKQWEAEQELKDREEATNDVTKKSAVTAFSGFYGNLNRSAMMEQKKSGEVVSKHETDRNEEADKDTETDAKPPGDDDFDPRQGFLGGFERSSLAFENGDIEAHAKNTDRVEDEGAEKVASIPKLSDRERREKKVAEARIRYLKRKQERESQQ